MLLYKKSYALQKTAGFLAHPVCNTITLEILDVESSFSVCGYILRGYGSNPYTMVIESMSREQNNKLQIPHSRKPPNTLIGNNSGSTEDRAEKLSRSIADRMVWPPFLSRDGK